MIDANPIPHSIFGASMACALFVFIAMLYTHAVSLDIVGTLWICTLSAITMQMTIPIAMCHGCPMAFFMQAVRIHHDNEWCLEDGRCR